MMDLLDIFGDVLKSTTRDEVDKFRQVSKQWNSWITGLENTLPLKSIPALSVDIDGRLFLTLEPLEETHSNSSTPCQRLIIPAKMAAHFRKSAVEVFEFDFSPHYRRETEPFNEQKSLEMLRNLVGLTGHKLMVRKFCYMDYSRHRERMRLTVEQDDTRLIAALPQYLELMTAVEVKLWLLYPSFESIMLNPEIIDFEDMPPYVELCIRRSAPPNLLLSFMERRKSRMEDRYFSLRIGYSKDFCEKYFEKFCEPNGPQKLFKEVQFGDVLRDCEEDYKRTLDFVRSKMPGAKIIHDVIHRHQYRISKMATAYEYERKDRWVFRVEIGDIIVYKVFRRGPNTCNCITQKDLCETGVTIVDWINGDVRQWKLLSMNQLDIFNEVLKSANRDEIDKFRQVSKRWNGWIIALENTLPLKLISQISIDIDGKLHVIVDMKKPKHEIDPVKMAAHLRKSVVSRLQFNIERPIFRFTKPEELKPFDVDKSLENLRSLIDVMGCKLIVQKFSYYQSIHTAYTCPRENALMVTQDDEKIITALPQYFELISAVEAKLWSMLDYFKYVMQNPELIDFENMPTEILLGNQCTSSSDLILEFAEKKKSHVDRRRFSLDICYAYDDFCEKYFEKFCEPNGPQKLFKEILFGAHFDDYDDFLDIDEYKRTLDFVKNKLPKVQIIEDVPDDHQDYNQIKVTAFEHQRSDHWVFRVEISNVIVYKVFKRDPN
ncbi:hypothetical protein Ddc_09758 [Ditylenchus destructor]|nr:hypothetical protein Ddc_09758 [Ditylenchus destructor]